MKRWIILLGAILLIVVPGVAFAQLGPMPADSINIINELRQKFIERLAYFGLKSNDIMWAIAAIIYLTREINKRTPLAGYALTGVALAISIAYWLFFFWGAWPTVIAGSFIAWGLSIKFWDKIFKQVVPIPPRNG